jgi:RHS repeat-associated protein
MWNSGIFVSSEPWRRSYYQFDGSSNTVLVTDAAQKLLDSYAYLPFGEKVSSVVNLANPFTYVGQSGVADDEDGLYYMRARYYNPTAGRFIGEDPIGLGGGDPNLYRYVGNLPTLVTDPLGLVVPPRLGFPWNSTPATQSQAPGACGIAAAETCAVVGYLLTPAEPWVAIPVGAACSVGSAELCSMLSPEPLTKSEVTCDALTAALPPLTGAIAGGACPGVPLVIDAVPFAINDAISVAGSTLSIGFPLTDLAYTLTIGAGNSSDPNGKITVGYGDQGFIPPDATITYAIYFENQPSATLPAQKVVVTDPLDSNLDWSTVQVTQIGFNTVVLSVPSGVQSYSAQGSVSTDPNPVSVSASLDPNSGTLTWTMQSIDLTTGAIPQNPLAGFLPPDNSSRQGEGYLVYTVKPKSGVANGTTIYNQASIVFDMNTAIQTNKVTNTIDSVYPSSNVDPLPVTTTTASFPVSWSGSDPTGAGIANYDIYVATDNGPYTSWLLHTTTTTATFSASFGHSYSFYSIATDNVGYRQQTPGPVQTTTVAAVTITTVSVNPSTVTGGGSATLTLQLNASAPAGGVTVSLTSSNQAAFPVPPTLTVASSQNSASISIQSGIVSTPTPVSITATYNTSSQQTQVTVNPVKKTPVVTVTPPAPSISTAQPLTVTVAVSGSPVPTGTVTLTSGSFTSATVALGGGSVSINIPAGSLTTGTDTLTVNYTPDNSSSPIYNSATGSSSIVVVVPTYSMTAGSVSISLGNAGQSTVTVSTANGYVGTVTLTCVVSSGPAGGH